MKPAEAGWDKRLPCATCFSRFFASAANAFAVGRSAACGEHKPSVILNRDRRSYVPTCFSRFFMAAPNSFGAFGAVGSTMGIEQELVDLTSELVAIPSVSDDAARREAVIAYVERYCRALPGVHVERLTCNGFPSLVAAFDDRRHKALVLNAHLDVVPARPEQFKPHVRDGKLYGRGAQDMKGAAAAFLLVLKTLAESGRHPSVAWQFVSDEEIGGDDGSGYLLQSGYTTDFFLAGEPTDLSIVNRAKGVLWVEVQQIGNPAHGSRPWDGDNPLVALAGGIRALAAALSDPRAAGMAYHDYPGRPTWRRCPKSRAGRRVAQARYSARARR